MAPSWLKALIAVVPLASATLSIRDPLVKRADPYPFCDPAKSPGCIDGGRYLVPILEFSNRDDKGDAAYEKYLPTRAFHTSRFTDNRWPEQCQYWGITADKFNSSDFETYNVTFSDGCAGNPFVVCYHKRSQNSLQTVLTWISKIPIGVRQSVSTYLVYSLDNPNYHGIMATLAGDGIIIGRNDFYFPTALVHEHGHAVDSNLIGVNGGAYSTTQAWKNAYNADYAAVSAYGAGSGVEDFAEAGRAVLLDNIYPGGLKNFSNNNPNLTQIANQMRVAHGKLDLYYTTTSRCNPTKKFPYPRMVTKS